MLFFPKESKVYELLRIFEYSIKTLRLNIFYFVSAYLAQVPVVKFAKNDLPKRLKENKGTLVPDIHSQFH